MNGTIKRFRLDSFAAANTGTIINIPKLMSGMNQKYIGHTDEEGNVYSYPYRLVFRPTDVPTESSVADCITTEIPNIWRVRNAWKKWHFARREMFHRVGISKSEMGRYGRLLRPYMDLNHSKGTVYADARSFNLGATGSWQYSKISSNLDWPDDFDIASLATLDMIDSYTLHVCNDHVLDANVPVVEGVEQYDSIGMVLSYNQDRMELVVPQTDEAFNKINPLGALTSNDATGGEVSDTAAAQQVEEPPYDNQDAGDSIQTITTGTGNGRTTGGIFSISGLACGGYVLVTGNLPVQVYLEVGAPILSKDC